MTEKNLWLKANQQLIAKSIGELSYEQILTPEIEAPDTYKLTLSSGVVYRFKAWRTLWDHLRVNESSIERVIADSQARAEDAGQFFIDAQKELEMTDITLGCFLEEMHATLYSDMALLKSYGHVMSQDMCSWDGLHLQSALNGHPKILLNKGRLGWGSQDLSDYSPESQKEFQLHWIAVSTSHALSGLSESTTWKRIYSDSLKDAEIAAFRAKLEECGVDPENAIFVPVHPWQWDRVLKFQFAGDIANRNIVDLGCAGDLYRAQISLRTLSNTSRPEKPDIKLPLSILNTSAVRGISPRYIENAPSISQAVNSLCARDTFLKESGVVILKDIAGVALAHKLYRQIENAPYRYKETLGAIWRESATSHLKESEQCILSGALFHKDASNNSLIGAYIKKSGLSINDWLEKYFDHVVIPLYHLQLHYGLGLVAHGQNVAVRLTKSIPSGVFLKDFQGDLRLSKEFKLDADSALQRLDRLPPEYLIHDLITGHFVTVLRFVSATLEECDGFREESFYKTMASRLKKYLEQQKIQNMDTRLGLLTPQIHRVLLNKVRFKIGYADTTERPLPLVGTALSNPLFHGAQNG